MCAHDHRNTERPARQGFLSPRLLFILDDIRADLDDKGVSTAHLTDNDLFERIMAVWFTARRLTHGEAVTPDAMTRAIRLMAAVSAAERVA